MKHSYRLELSVLCALAAFGGPILFLEDRPRAGYLLGGAVAALLTWALVEMMMYFEQSIPNWLQGVLGAGAALLSWAPITLVAIFDIIPHLSAEGFNRFDPVWIGGGVVAPLVILGAAALRAGSGWLQAVLTAIFRYSVPLLVLDWLARVPQLPKQYPWLFLFTGALFLTLDSLWAPKT